MSDLAVGKSPKYRIRALRRRIESGAIQARIHANVATAYADAVRRDLDEVARLEAEIAASESASRRG
jgi:hypothetical protein